MSRRFTLSVALMLGVVPFLTGCDDLDGPGPRQTSPVEAQAQRMMPRPRRRPLPPPVPVDAPDSGPDYLLPKDATPEPTLAERDTLSEAGGMPTVHSHWLRGSIVGGTVTVSLNSKSLGDLTGNLDRDITMSCRKGTNMIALTFRPNAAGTSSFARLEVVEGEHDIPIPPLVTFTRTRTGSLSSTDKTPTPSPQTETQVFIAR